MRNTTSSVNYLKKARRLIAELKLEQCPSFNAARKKVFNSLPLQQLVSQNLNQPIVALSPGTSRAEAFRPLLQQAAADWLDNKFYRDYQVTAGSWESRLAVARLESAGLRGTAYQPDDIAFTEGSTGAITAVMEALARNNNRGKQEVIIASPTYYLYQYAAKYLDLPYREVNLLSASGTTLAPLIKAITDQTALVIICNPGNPSGELYDPAEMRRLLTIAQQNQAIVMADELFAELVFADQLYTSFGQLAAELKTMETLVTIKGYSKSKNLAALRVGYVLTKNQSLMSQILTVLEQRQCFPVASAFTGLICLDSFLQLASRRGKITTSVITKLQQQFADYSAIQEKLTVELTRLAQDYQQYLTAQQSSYQNLYQQALQELGDLVSAKTNTAAAFNTFVKIDALNQVDQLDFTINLYLQTGVKIEIGPCFGWTQQTWQQNPQLGFWLRLTFAQEPKQYLDGIRRLKAFIPQYCATSR